MEVKQFSTIKVQQTKAIATKTLKGSKYWSCTDLQEKVELQQRGNATTKSALFLKKVNKYLGYVYDKEETLILAN